jgi:hypothetical protein
VLPATIGLAAVQTAIEYEYRFTEYRPPRRTEYEYDEKSFNPQPTARKWLFCTHIVLSISTTRMKELASIDTANASSFLHRRGPAA